MSRSRSDMPAGWTATPAYHPEFGRLSPYARKRAGLPLPLLLIAGGIAVSVTIGFASGHWGNGEAPTTTVEQVQAPAAKPSDFCTTSSSDDSEASFVSSICGHSRLRAKHHTRFSTVVLGRATLPSAPPPEPSEKVQSERAEKAPATSAPERVAAAKRPKAKSRASTLAAQAREFDRQNAFDAFASARRFSYAPRPMTPQWGYNGPFGPSW